MEKTLTVRPISGMWSFDPAQEVPEGGSPDMVNFQVYGGVLRKRPGFAPYTIGTFPSERVTGLYSTHDDDGNSRLYCTTAQFLWRYNGSTKNWELMSGPTLTGATKLFSFIVYASKLVFCQGTNNVLTMPLNSTTYAEISPDSFPARYLANFNRRVYTAFTKEPSDRPYRVRWCANDAPTDWTGVGSGFIDRNDDPYFIRNIKKLMTAMAVYTEKSIWLAQATGSALNPASYDRIVDDVGLSAPHSLAGRNTQQFFVGQDDFYLLNGTQVIPIATAVRSHIFRTINPDLLEIGFGVLDVNTQEYIAFLVEGLITAPQTAWVVNWEAKAVYPWRTLIGHTYATTHKGTVGITIGELQGTIAQQNWILSSPAYNAQYPFVLTGGTDGKVYYWDSSLPSDNGQPINCSWRSRDYTAKDIDPSFAGEMITLKSIGISVLDPGKPFTLQFYLSNDGGANWTGPFPMTFGGSKLGVILDGMFTQQITGSRVAFKFENNTATETPQIVVLYPTLERKQQKMQPAQLTVEGPLV